MRIEKTIMPAGHYAFEITSDAGRVLAHVPAIVAVGPCWLVQPLTSREIAYVWKHWRNGKGVACNAGRQVLDDV
jgi:hypothetical protein